MESPYTNIENKYFYLHDIPFLPLAVRGNAVNCRIGLSKQLVFIPVKYFNYHASKGISLKDNVNLEWFYNKIDTQRKIKYYLIEKEEVS